MGKGSPIFQMKLRDVQELPESYPVVGLGLKSRENMYLTNKLYTYKKIRNLYYQGLPGDFKVVSGE